MASNKENKKSEISKIPRLEDRLASRNKREELSNARDPLKTLLDPNVEKNAAGPSSYVSKALDMRYVTYRNTNNHELDWNFEVFKDKARQQVSKLPVPTNAVALPLKTPTEIPKSRPIKKSLKRPHSKEAKAASPNSAEISNYCPTIYPKSDSNGLFNGVSECFTLLNQTYMQDNLMYLLSVERRMGEPQIRSVSRSCVINWIINVNGSIGNPAIMQLAVFYLDSYLSTTTVSVNKLQVLAASCFWISAKFHGRRLTARRVVKYSGFAFTEADLVAAERIILKKLRFEASAATPHDFVPYLSWYSDQTGSGQVEAAAVFLCQCALMVHKHLGEHPSVVAAAAVRNALVLLKLSVEKLEGCPVYQKIQKKAINWLSICQKLNDAVRLLISVQFEYKAPLVKFNRPPFYIASKIVRAIRDI